MSVIFINPSRFGSAGNTATITYTDSKVDATSSSSYTFSAAAIGTASTGRRIVVGFGCANDVAFTISSVTIGGVSATSVVETSFTGGGANGRVGLFIATLDTGTTADVVVTTSATCLRAGIGVWAISNLLSSTPTSTGSDATGATYAAGLTVDAGGVTVCYAQTYYSPTPSFTASNYTEDFDATVESQIGHTGGHDSYASADSPTLTITPSGHTAGGGVFASFA